VQSRRDQLQAYRFLVRRAVGAVVNGEPDVAESPMRRLTTITLAGIMVAVLAATGVGLYGLIRPSASTAWKNPGAIIEDPQATLFIYQGGFLTEVANYATGALALAGTGKTATLTHASNKALAGIPRRARIGNPAWPADLPTKASALLTGPWTVCSTTIGSANSIKESVDLKVGQKPGGDAVAAQTAVLVQTPLASDPVLIWDGYQLTVKNQQQFIPVGAIPTYVGSDFLAAIPPWGINLGANKVPGTGLPLTVTLPGLAPAGLKVGDLITVQSATYVALKSNTFALATGAVLKMLQDVGGPTHTASAAPSTQQLTAGPPLALPGEATDFNLAPVSNNYSKVCASYSPKSGADAAGTWTTTTAANPNLANLPSNVQGSHIIDAADGQIPTIGLTDNSAAIVTRVDATGSSVAANRGIVTSDGFFGISDATALTALGYQNASVVALPPTLIRLLPKGAPLNPTQARCREASIVIGGCPG
jgi:type VII secretion protein EccB